MNLITAASQETVEFLVVYSKALQYSRNAFTVWAKQSLIQSTNKSLIHEENQIFILDKRKVTFLRKPEFYSWVKQNFMNKGAWQLDGFFDFYGINWFGTGTFYNCLSLCDFGVEFAEIFVIQNPSSLIRRVRLRKSPRILWVLSPNSEKSVKSIFCQKRYGSQHNRLSLRIWAL